MDSKLYWPISYDSLFIMIVAPSSHSLQFFLTKYLSVRTLNSMFESLQKVKGGSLGKIL